MLDDMDCQDIRESLSQTWDVREPEIMNESSRRRLGCFGHTARDRLLDELNGHVELGMGRDAMRLRKETTLVAKQIADRLYLGSPGSANVCLRASIKNTRDISSGTLLRVHLESERTCKAEAPFPFLSPSGMLLRGCKVEEEVIRIEDLRRCDRVFLVNSVRGLWQVEWEQRAEFWGYGLVSQLCVLHPGEAFLYLFKRRNKQ